MWQSGLKHKSKTRDILEKKLELHVILQEWKKTNFILK